VLGMISGAVAGLGTITPASGHEMPLRGFVICVIAGQSASGPALGSSSASDTICPTCYALCSSEEALLATSLSRSSRWPRKSRCSMTLMAERGGRPRVSAMIAGAWPEAGRRPAPRQSPGAGADPQCRSGQALLTTAPTKLVSRDNDDRDGAPRRWGWIGIGYLKILRILASFCNGTGLSELSQLCQLSIFG
jgi:hypothetical protein